MPARTVRIFAIAVAVLTASVAVWRWFGGEERAIRTRLEGLRDEVNAGAKEGLESVARAAAIGSYFTPDVVVDLGQGTAPIAGRETLMGMAARLQPRTAAFRLEVQDVGVALRPDGEAADVNLTATFARRSVSTGEESLDAREFSAVMAKDGGTWRIARLTAVDTLR
jgi:hypothetical protein